jgi:hypothetical protein
MKDGREGLSTRVRCKIAAQAVIRAKPSCCLAALVYILPNLLLSILSMGIGEDTPLRTKVLLFGLMLVVQIFVLLPLYSGLRQMLLFCLVGREGAWGEMMGVLSSGKAYLRALRYALCVEVRGLLLLLPPTVVYIGVGLLVQSDAAFYLLSAVYIVVAALCAVKAYGYRGCFVLAFDNPSLGAWQATKQAGTLFQGRYKELLLFVLSFLPWMLVVLLTMGAAMLFVLPYMCLSLDAWVNELRGGWPEKSGEKQADTSPWLE